MKHTITRFLFLAAMTAGLLMPTAIYAWDTMPDSETGLYDGVYDRPTFFPDWEQPATWPTTMYVLCEVRKEIATGKRIESYEVAVYDQSNTLRHCGRSLAKQDHYCVLTIPGEEGVDQFHFQVIYGDDFAYPMVAEIKETSLYFESNASIGTAEEPFLLIVVKSTPTGVDGSDHRPSSCRKFMKDGVLMIEREGKIYNALGF